MNKNRFTKCINEAAKFKIILNDKRKKTINTITNAVGKTEFEKPILGRQKISVGFLNF